MVTRFIEKQILAKSKDPKAIVVFGARQVGKTTMLKSLFPENESTLWLNGDDLTIRKTFETINLEKWKILLSNKSLLVIDEAQRIADIGIKIKLVIDHLPVKVILSGSSSFELANSFNEPLTGRKWEFKLFPFSFNELASTSHVLQEKQLLEHRLVFGNYPDVVNNTGSEQEILTLLADSYLYKDILSWQKVRKPEKLKMLVQALAFQIGQEVSYNELGKTIGMDNQSIENYVDLLEKNFIVFRLPPLSRNLRKELKTKRKIYFWDNGIRNAAIAQFQPFELRADRGALWENWIISERLKYLNNNGVWAKTFFWRTSDQQEIDFIEERNGLLSAFEIKWNSNKHVRFPRSFLKAYPISETNIINPDNFYEYLL